MWKWCVTGDGLTQHENVDFFFVFALNAVKVKIV